VDTYKTMIRVIDTRFSEARETQAYFVHASELEKIEGAVEQTNTMRKAENALEHAVFEAKRVCAGSPGYTGAYLAYMREMAESLRAERDSMTAAFNALGLKLEDMKYVDGKAGDESFRRYFRLSAGIPEKEEEARGIRVSRVLKDSYL